MTLFFSDKQFNYPEQVRFLSRAKTLCRAQECPPLRLLAELKRSDGACKELPFVWPQNVGNALRNTARMQSLMFEMIQPDLEISSTHVATLLVAQHRV